MTNGAERPSWQREIIITDVVTRNALTLAMILHKTAHNNVRSPESKGFTYLASGIDRSTYRRGDLVYKWSQHYPNPKFESQNSCESRSVERLISLGVRNVPDCVTIDCGKFGTVNVMWFIPGARVGNMTRDVERTLRSLENKYGMNDLHQGNFRVVDGEPVVFDVGIPREIFNWERWEPNPPAALRR